MTSRRQKERERDPEKFRLARREERRKYRAKHKGKPRGDVKAQRSRYKKRHPDKNRASQNRSNARIRYEVIGHYSQGTYKCASCGDRHMEFLEIDHINGGGKQHKRSIPGNDTYRWLRKNNYPSGYQVLCSNCNMKKVKLDAKERGTNGTISQQKYYQRNQRDRLETFNHYSQNGIIQCACCGITDTDLLCLDHKNGDGAEHRRNLTKADGSNVARWARRNNYPPIFRILCHNCNQSLGKYGYCPHHLPSRYAAFDPEVQSHQHDPKT